MMLVPDALWRVGDISLRVSLGIVALMVMRQTLRRIAGAPSVALLWLVLALRLLLPWPLEAQWGLPSPFKLAGRADAGVTDAVRPRFHVVVVLPANGGHREQVIAPGGERNAITSHAAWFHAADLLNFLWALGTTIAAFRLALGWRQTYRWVGVAINANDEPRLAHVLATIVQRHRCGVVLCLTDAVESPALTGVFHPRIWLPRSWSAWLSDEELHHVLLHELGHVRRRDLLAQWICALACCVHWFNPLVWLLARLAREDREMACDAWVLAQSHDQGGSFAARYGQTLLKVVDRLRARPVLRHALATVMMATTRRNLGSRVRGIAAYRPLPLWRVRGLAGALAVLAVIVTIDRAAHAQKPGPGDVPPSSDSKPVLPAEVMAAPKAPSATVVPEPGSSPTPPSIAAAAAADPQLLQIKTIMVALTKSAVRQLEAEAANDGRHEWLGGSGGVAELKQADGSPGTTYSNFVLHPDELEKLLKRFKTLSGATIVSSPQVTTPSGESATVEILKEISYPAEFTKSNLPGVNTPVLTPSKFTKARLGLTWNFVGSVSPPVRDIINLATEWELDVIQGWTSQEGKPVANDDDPPAGSIPTISNQTSKSTVSVPAGGTFAFFNSVPHVPKAIWDALSLSDEPPNEEVTILNLVTVSLIEKLAYAKGEAIPGRPGFLKSPYGATEVDARSLRTGNEVRDPYTNRIFLVP